jgi:hypothetical protein
MHATVAEVEAELRLEMTELAEAARSARREADSLQQLLDAAREEAAAARQEALAASTKLKPSDAELQEVEMLRRDLKAAKVRRLHDHRVDDGSMHPFEGR